MNDHIESRFEVTSTFRNIILNLVFKTYILKEKIKFIILVCNKSMNKIQNDSRG